MKLVLDSRFLPRRVVPHVKMGSKAAQRNVRWGQVRQFEDVNIAGSPRIPDVVTAISRRIAVRIASLTALYGVISAVAGVNLVRGAPDQPIAAFTTSNPSGTRLNHGQHISPRPSRPIVELDEFYRRSRIYYSLSDCEAVRGAHHREHDGPSVGL